jgi:2-polyprenyl-6-methoxyphenol hydroxylase-like FAD-dependent oxidoreductase
MVPDTTVLVAGGGIGGLALGIALTRAGLAARVIEKTASRRRTGAGLVLYPNGIRALAAISPALPEAVMAAGYVPEPDDARPILNPAGDVLAVDRVGDLAQRYGVPQVSVLRSELEAALLREADRAGVQVRHGISVVGQADRSRDVMVSLSDGTSASASALVGADGLRSGVRWRLLGDGPPRYRGYTTVRGQSPRRGPYPQGAIVNGNGTGLFAAPVDGDNFYWTAKLAAPPGVWPAKEPGRVLTDLASALAGWHPPILSLIGAVGAGQEGLVVSDIYDREPVGGWTSGRVTLLGDAAHPMVPGAGQGVSMALEDAAVLTAALRADDDIPRALRGYASRRVSRTSMAVRQSRRADTFLGGEGRDFSTEDSQLTDLFGWQPDASGVSPSP